MEEEEKMNKGGRKTSCLTVERCKQNKPELKCTPRMLAFKGKVMSLF
jgi:hypothetical protein